MCNNNVIISGQLCGEIKRSHTFLGENYYNFNIAVMRKSGVKDIIRAEISGKKLEKISLKEGQAVGILGEFRSRNICENQKNKLLLSVFVKEIEIIDKNFSYENTVLLCGFVCKKITVRKTPFGRDIADVLLAVNRTNDKSDYIPCVAWGKHALMLKNVGVGQRLNIEGRIQSRAYHKENEIKIAYEISVMQLSIKN